MSTKIDAKGLACPGPVIATKKALESIEQGIVTIVVDNEVAKENVVKFATAHGCGVSITKQAGDFTVKITKGEAVLAPDKIAAPLSAPTENLVYLITQNTLGHGSSELGAVLMKSFMYALLESTVMPKTILFMNAGIMLTIKSSPVLEHLETLDQRGVEILSCGTCLDYFAVKNELAIGGVTNMYTIIEAMSAANKVITL